MSKLSNAEVQELLRRSGVPMLKSAAVAVVASPEDKSITQKPKNPAANKQSTFLSDEIVSLLSQQVGNESFAAYSYFGGAAWFGKRGLDGFKKMCETQAMDEIGHARKVFNHLVDANAPLTLPPIVAPFMEYQDVKEVCSAILDHEKSVTKSWRAIGDKALEDKDMATMSLAQWFITEQIEEENKASALYDRVKMAKDAGILIIDSDLKKG